MLSVDPDPVGYAELFAESVSAEYPVPSEDPIPAVSPVFSVTPVSVSSIRWITSVTTCAFCPSDVCSPKPKTKMIKIQS